jgi:hypothetical protein
MGTAGAEVRESGSTAGADATADEAGGVGSPNKTGGVGGGSGSERGAAIGDATSGSEPSSRTAIAASRGLSRGVGAETVRSWRGTSVDVQSIRLPIRREAASVARAAATNKTSLTVAHLGNAERRHRIARPASPLPSGRFVLAAYRSFANAVASPWRRVGSG